MLFKRWDQESSTEETNTFLIGLALAHICEVSLASQDSINITSALTSLQSMHEEERRQAMKVLCEYELDYETHRAHPLNAYHLRQALAFFSKREDVDIGVDKEKVAWDKFVAAERKCAETNDVFRAWSHGRLQFSRDVEQVLFLAQRKIAQTIGDVPSFSELKFRFGPGATTNVKRKIANPRNKLGNSLACSEDLAPALSAVLGEMPAWVFSGQPEELESVRVPVEIHAGRLSFVPKNAKTFRSVVTEPVLNGLVQLAIGDLLVGRLKASGLDLKKQERNQALAQLGSLTGELATLDLSSASDLISKELVYHLLPIDWASFLALSRTGVVEYRGSQLRLHKFSSMGNGYTFPLESLIFWALASSATKVACGGLFGNNHNDQVGVYGDDIIVPVGAVDLLIRTLTACGFEVNSSKSFWRGPFRESCGKDYLSGIDIRPIYVKDRLIGADLFRLHNYYKRTWQNELASYVLRHIAEPLQLWGPDGYGDGHLLGEDPSEYLRPHRRTIPANRKVPGGWGGWTFETFSWKPRLDFRVSPGDRVFPLYSIYERYPWVSQPRYEYIRSADLSGLEFQDLGDSPARRFDKSGRLGVSIPGRQGYRRIKIYTLDPQG